MIILKRVLPTAPHLRLVLMSATLHTELFSSYFGGCPIIEVPGRMFPVEDLYLEDCLQLTGYQDAVARPRLAAPVVQVHPEERVRVEKAIMNAFVGGSEATFAELLEATGSVGADDVREGAPCVNVVHPQTGGGFWGGVGHVRW